MKQSSLISIDLAKNVFQLGIIDSNWKVIKNAQISRKALPEFMIQQPQSEVVMEACYSSHYWARVFTSMGHLVHLIPAQHVKPFVIGDKSDRNDVIAIAEASRRPRVKFVPIKTIDQMEIQSLHRVRDRVVRLRTGLVNQIRGLLSEHGVITAQGLSSFHELLKQLVQPDNSELPPILKVLVQDSATEYAQLSERIRIYNNQLARIANTHPFCKLLMSIPGIGYINATAIVCMIGDGSQFANGREFAVWLGITPKQSGSGEKTYRMGISKRGNRYLRKQLIHGARSLVFRSTKRKDKLSQWVNNLRARRGANKAAVALANKLARIIWIMLQKKVNYQPA